MGSSWGMLGFWVESWGNLGLKRSKHIVRGGKRALWGGGTGESSQGKKGEMGGNGINLSIFLENGGNPV